MTNNEWGEWIRERYHVPDEVIDDVPRFFVPRDNFLNEPIQRACRGDMKGQWSKRSNDWILYTEIYDHKKQKWVTYGGVLRKTVKNFYVAAQDPSR